MSKGFAAFVGSVACCLILAGCPSPPGGDGSDASGGGDQAHGSHDYGEPVQGGQLVARYLGKAKFLNPVIAETVADGYINDQIYPYLTDSTFENCEIGAPPLLASSYEWSDGREGEPGGRTMTYHLREDVVWSDGKPITAEDVLFSYGLYRNASVASPRYSFTEFMDEIEAPDPYTVVFRFSKIYPQETQIFHTGLGIVPQHLLADVPPADLRNAEFNRMPVTAGSYKLVQWDPGAELVLERCENCNLREPAYLDRIVIRIIPEETTALVALKRGTIDFMELSTYEPVADIKKNHPDIRIIKRGYRFLDYVGWNTKDPSAIKAAQDALPQGGIVDLDAIPPHPLFGDPDVRRALTMAIDRQSMLEALTSVAGETYGRQATGTVTPELCKDYAEIQPLPYDPQRAKELLASAGWKDTDGDTVLDKNGRKFAFTMNYNQGNNRRRDGCVFIQSMLEEIGVQVSIEPIESSVFFTNLRKKQFDASLAGWSAALVIDPTDMWHSGAEYTFNFTSYSNAEVDRLIEEGVATMDPEQRREIWKEIQRRIYHDQPYTFLYWMNGLALVHDRFQNVQTNVLSAYYHVHEWWVPEELRKYQTRKASR